MKPRLRLDEALVARGHFDSREQAKRAVLAGLVEVDHRRAAKPGTPVGPDAAIRILARERYVSRGGRKLEHALQAFRLDLTGKRAIDFGASTGGFTDCLLQHGIACVYAVDVGKGQLAWKLRQDPRVRVMEGTNARHLTREHFPPPFEPADFVTIDCSFISQRLLLPPAVALLKVGGSIVSLIKPQFEAGKAEADRTGGVIKDPAVHRRVIEELRDCVSQLPGLRWREVVESPILGPAGNREFLAWIEKER